MFLHAIRTAIHVVQPLKHHRSFLPLHHHLTKIARGTLRHPPRFGLQPIPHPLGLLLPLCFLFLLPFLLYLLLLQRLLHRPLLLLSSALPPLFFQRLGLLGSHVVLREGRTDFGSLVPRAVIFSQRRAGEAEGVAEFVGRGEGVRGTASRVGYGGVGPAALEEGAEDGGGARVGGGGGEVEGGLEVGSGAGVDVVVVVVGVVGDVGEVVEELVDFG
mmetsp:Transcript_25015/g.51903  ORF Transcript_25015/g.51903 Transcript_25015/m.51903 type:complete len:216 (-) Transcript_25015:351-998(-)